MIEIPKNAISINMFSQKDQETLERLDEIFWQEIPITNNDCASGKRTVENAGLTARHWRTGYVGRSEKPKDKRDVYGSVTQRYP